jgi:hypothetical protein
MDDEWRPLLAAREQRLELSMRAVGKLLNGSGDAAWNGTAFLVGDRLAMTASFVALEFIDGAGSNATIKKGRTPALDFGDALRSSDGDAIAPVSRVRFIHPYFQLALLEFEAMPEGVAVLDLSAQVPSQLSGRLVAVIAIALRHGASVLLLQPGKALQLGQLPGDLPLPALVHDCDTGAGSAGAPVIDLGTGSVVGIHTHTERQTRGFAQPSWELARDPYVWEYGIRFRPDPKPPWLGSWKVPGARPLEPQPSVPEPESDRWTVADVPIDWGREEPKQMEELLVKTVDVRMALLMAENVRFDLTVLDANVPPQSFWRDLLKKLSVAGRLGPLLEEIASRPQYEGIAPQLRTYL